MADATRLPDDVAAAVDAGDAHALVTGLAPLSDRHRRALLRPARDRLLASHRLRPARHEWPVHLQTLDLVVELGCCNPSAVSWAWWRLARDPATRETQLALATEALAARPMSARRALVRGIRDGHGSAAAAWPVLRALQDRGLLGDVDLDDDDLAVGAVRAVWWLAQTSTQDADWRDPPQDVMVRAMQLDPALADHLLHALTHPPALDAAGDAWPDWLAHAVRTGAVPRDVVLRAVLRSQDADIRPSTAHLLRKMLDALAPTADELVAYETDLVRVLAAAHPSAQRQAADHLRTLAEAGRLADAEAAAVATVGPLTGRQKAAALAALRLLGALDLDDATATTAAVVGLSHAHEDVQGRALDLVEERTASGPPAPVREEALLHLDTVAPAHRDRIATLAGVADLDTDAPTSTATDIASLEARAAALPDAVRHALDVDGACAAARADRPPRPAAPAAAAAPPGGVVTPVTDVVELGELLGFLLAGSAGPIDLERAIDGLARFDGRRAPDTVTSVVRHHAAAIANQGLDAGSGVLGSLVWQLAADWAGGRPPSRLEHLQPTDAARGLDRLFRRGPRAGLLHDVVTPPRATLAFDEQHDGGAGLAGLAGFVQGRLFEAVVIGQTTPRPTLSLPTDTTGWINEDVFIERVHALDGRGTRPGRHEAVAALLRLRRPAALHGQLPTDGTTAAIAAAVGGDERADPALRRALERGPTLGELTLASAEQRPGLVRPTPWFAVDVVPPWRRDDPVGQLLAELTETESRHAASWWNPARNVLPEADRPLMAWAPTAVPRDPHLLAAAASRAILVDPDADRSSSAIDALLAHAVDPDVALRHPWHLLLATALRGGNRVAGITAADVVAAAAADARLDPQLLGAHLARLHTAGVGASNRVVERLAPLVTTSPLVAAAVRRALQAWVAAVEGLPRDLHHVLGLVETACTACGAGIDDDAARTVLERAGAGRSKRAAIAGRLLALPAAAPADEPVRLAAAVLDRAERWAVDGAAVHRPGQ